MLFADSCRCLLLVTGVWELAGCFGVFDLWLLVELFIVCGLFVL